MRVVVPRIYQNREPPLALSIEARLWSSDHMYIKVKSPSGLQVIHDMERLNVSQHPTPIVLIVIELIRGLYVVATVLKCVEGN